MTKALVSDTSVLIDLECGSLVELAFRLPYVFVVPDLLYMRELRDQGDIDYRILGLCIKELDGAGVALALQYRRLAAVR